MRHALTIVLLASGCVGEPPQGSHAELAPAAMTIRDLGASAAEGSDAPPRLEVSVRTDDGREITRAASAAVRFGGGAAFVDDDHRLLAIDARGDVRELATEIGGRPVADANGERVAWSEPVDLAESDLRASADGATFTIARAPGVMSPIAIRGDHVVLVGAINGGVAGIWLAELRAGGALACATNCDLRAGRPWGDAYVPPPESGESLRVASGEIIYRAADGTDHVAQIPGALR